MANPRADVGIPTSPGSFEAWMRFFLEDGGMHWKRRHVWSCGAMLENDTWILWIVYIFLWCSLGF